MKVAVAVLFVATLAVPLFSQLISQSLVEHCRTDVAGWTHNFNYDLVAKDDPSLTYAQMKDRAIQMDKCSMQENQEPYLTAVRFMAAHYDGLMRDRLHDFLVRHSLLEQFQQEDTSGLR